MKSFLAIFLAFVVFMSVDSHLRKKSQKSATEAETAYQIKKLKKAVNSLQKQLAANDCNSTNATRRNKNAIPTGNNTNVPPVDLSTNSSNNSNTTNGTLNTSNTGNDTGNSNSQQTHTINQTNNQTNNQSNNQTTSPTTNPASSSSSNSSNSSSNSSSSPNSQAGCKCKDKISAAHLFALNSLVQRANGEDENALLHSNSIKKSIFRKKKLTKFFVEKLLLKLQITPSIVTKCVKAPLSTYAKILQLSHDIVKGKAGFGQLSILSNWLCEDLKIIPEKLNDSGIFNDVRNFLNNYIAKK